MTSGVPMQNGFIWFDAEFSSLELESAQLLQIAAIATDAELNRLLPAEKDLRLFIKLSDPESLSEWVLQNIPHIVSGCMSDEAVPLNEATQALYAYVDEAFGLPSTVLTERPLMAGNSVHNDWLMCRRFFPDLSSRLHYRLLDVSAFKTQWEQWFNAKPFEKDNHRMVMRFFKGAHLDTSLREHDAYFDIQASIAELAYYRAGWKK